MGEEMEVMGDARRHPSRSEIEGKDRQRTKSQTHVNQ